MSGSRDESVEFRGVWSSNGPDEAATKLARDPERNGQIRRRGEFRTTKYLESSRRNVTMIT